MKTRLPSVDLLRGLAIIAMIQIHIWSRYIGTPSGALLAAFQWLFQPAGGYAAPLFTLIAGLSAQLSVKARRARYTGRELLVEFLKRGGLLFALSTLINVITGYVLKVLDISILNWSIFQLVGICLCLAPLFDRLSPILQLIVALAPLMITAAQPPTGWLLGPLSNGFAPFLPWSFLFFSGMLVGTVLSHILTKQRAQRYLLTVVLAGCLTLILSAVSASRAGPYVVSHLAHFGITNALVYVGVFLVLLGSVSYSVDFRERKAQLLETVIGFGKHALTIYYIQLFAVVASSMLVQMITGERPQLSPMLFLPLVILLLLVLHFVVDVIWAKFGHIYSVEWWMARLLVRRSRLPWMAADREHRGA